MNTIKSKIESLLFVIGEETTVAKIQKALGENVSPEDIQAGIEALRDEYREKGIRIVMKDDTIQIVSAPENADIIQALVKSQLDEELTPAALETLACIAYREPITKAVIDELRGVNSVFSLRALMMRGLIEKHDDHYRVTIDFLKKLGIERIADLPQYDILSKNS